MTPSACVSTSLIAELIWHYAEGRLGTCVLVGRCFILKGTVRSTGLKTGLNKLAIRPAVKND